jgi:hypothetical protein
MACGLHEDGSAANTAFESAGPGTTAADGGIDSGTAFPAPHPAFPSVVGANGPVVRAPVLVPVTFDGDENRGDIEAFVAAVGGTAYWKATTAEYGVGPAAAGAALHATGPAPKALDEVRAWLLRKLDGDHPGWPAPDANTIFALYLPCPGPDEVSACPGADACHDAVQVGSTSVPYAIIEECVDPGDDASHALVEFAAHELIEAATDPFITLGNTAFGGVDADHLIWQSVGFDEVADNCLPAPRVKLPGLPYVVPAIWSNAAAAAGTNPCVSGEVSEAPFFGGAAVLEDDVPFVTDHGTTTTKGIRLAVGEERTVDLVLFSDRATPPIDVVATDGRSELELRLDRSTGINGAHLRLTIKRVKTGTRSGGSRVAIGTSLGTTLGFQTFGFVAN